MRNKDEYAGSYAEKRLSTRRDDRCDRQKIFDDAELRGKIGSRDANRIISAIDDIKSRR